MTRWTHADFRVNRWSLQKNHFYIIATIKHSIIKASELKVAGYVEITGLGEVLSWLIWSIINISDQCRPLSWSELRSREKKYKMTAGRWQNENLKCVWMPHCQFQKQWFKPPPPPPNHPPPPPPLIRVGVGRFAENVIRTEQALKNNLLFHN